MADQDALAISGKNEHGKPERAWRGPVDDGQPIIRADREGVGKRQHPDRRLFFGNGAGIGASHQTGWSGLVLNLIHYFAANTQESRLASGGNTGLVPVQR